MATKVLELKEMVGKSPFTFRFSQYQRAFEWDIKNIIKLFESIESDLHFGVGTYKRDSAKREIEVIDGQQRLTAIAIMFGDAAKGIKFKFNFDASLNDDDINGAVNGTLDGDPTDAYVQHLVDLKGKFNEYLNENGKTNSDMNKLWKNINFPLVKIKTKKVEESFIAMNTSGITVDKLEIAKAYAVKNAKPREKKQIMTAWNQFIYKYHSILASASMFPSKNQLFNQVVSYIHKKDVKINMKNIQVYSKKKYFDEIVKYAEWAETILPGTKMVKKREILSLINHNKKINPYAPILTYHISNLKISLANKNTLIILLGVLNNISFLSGESISRYEESFFRNAIKIKGQKSLMEYIIQKINNLVSGDTSKIIEEWNSWNTVTFLRYARSGEKIKNSIDTVNSKYLLIQLEIIKNTIETKKYNYGNSINITDSLTVEHILNYKQNLFDYFTLIPKDKNEEVGNDVSKKRPVFISCLSEYPFREINPNNTLANAIKILEMEKKPSKYNADFKKSWKILK